VKNIFEVSVTDRLSHKISSNHGISNDTYQKIY